MAGSDNPRKDNNYLNDSYRHRYARTGSVYSLFDLLLNIVTLYVEIKTYADFVFCALFEIPRSALQENKNENQNKSENKNETYVLL